jgi:hypothetical protein
MNISSSIPGAGAQPAGPLPNFARKVDAQRTSAAGGAQDPVPGASRNAHPRLEAFAQKIEARFENALASQSLSARQREALEGQREEFHALIARFEAAYLDGDHASLRSTIDGMQKLLDHFGVRVSHILSGGNDAGAARGRDAGARDAQAPDRSAATLKRGGIDTLG